MKNFKFTKVVQSKNTKNIEKIKEKKKKTLQL